MKSVGLFFLLVVCSFVFFNTAIANASDLPNSLTVEKPLNYASLFSANTKQYNTPLELSTHEKLTQHVMDNDMIYVSKETVSDVDEFLISPYWFYVLKVIVLFGAFIWDATDRANFGSKRY